MYAVFDLQAESAKTFLGRVDLDGSVRRICDILNVSDYDIFQSVINKKTN